MRLFIAVNFYEQIKDSLCDVMARLKSHASKGNFTHRENLHLTLVFLGEIPQGKLTSIQKVMDQVTTERFKLEINGLGNFQRNGGDIYWIGVAENPALQAIQSHLARELSQAGFSIERRDFKPHLTIGREIKLQEGFNKQEFAKTVACLAMDVDRISLMKSERINGKLTYTEVYGKNLQP